MAEVRYLTLDEAIGLHDLILELTDSRPCPLLRRDTLESALGKARNAAWYEGADLIRQAVLLLVGISRAQAFLDFGAPRFLPTGQSGWFSVLCFP